MPTKKKITKTATKKTSKRAAKKTTKQSLSSTRGTTQGRRHTTSSSKHPLVQADPACCFWTTDAQILCNLSELATALETMDDSVYRYHATGSNDFAEWVEHTLQDAACAEELRGCRKPQTAARTVRRQLRLYRI